MPYLEQPGTVATAYLVINGDFNSHSQIFGGVAAVKCDMGREVGVCVCRGGGGGGGVDGKELRH